MIDQIRRVGVQIDDIAVKTVEIQSPSLMIKMHTILRVPRNLRDLPASDHHKKCLLVSSQQIISAQQYNIVGKLICIGYCLGNSQGVS